MTKKNREREVVVNLLGHPAVLAPAAIGAMVILSVPLFGAPLILLGVGVAGVAAGGGVAAWRARNVRDAINDRILERERQHQAQGREKKLCDLHKLLSSDDDPADETLLAQLRMLERDFKREEDWASVPLNVRVDLEFLFEQLFWVCIDELEKGFRLLDRSRRTATPGVRENLAQQQKGKLARIQESIQELEALMVKVAEIQSGVDSDEQREIVMRMKQNVAAAAQTQRQLANH
jgi:hypothetical protein